MTFMIGSNFGRLHMESDALLAVTPNQMAQALLDRRILLKEQLPTVIRTLEAEEQNLSPKVARIVANHKKANSIVAERKSERVKAKAEALQLLSKARGHYDNLVESGGMVSLDPNWKKEKLLEELDEIEESIQTSALDHKAEKKLIDRRKKLIEQNEKWLKDRRDSNPEMADYIDARREMSKLFTMADKSHSDMLQAVEKAQPLHDKKVAIQAEIREVRRQLDRAKELLSQSDHAIEHWQRRLKDGYSELGVGFPDLLRDMNQVQNGGASSFARKNEKNKQPPSNKKQDKRVKSSNSRGEEE